MGDDCDDGDDGGDGDDGDDEADVLEDDAGLEGDDHGLSLKE